MRVVRLREVDELSGMIEVQRGAWGKNELEIVPVHLLRAVADELHPTGLVLGYYDEDVPVGYLLGLPTGDPKAALMHQVAVVPSHASKGIAHELMSEMGWTYREMGIERVSWTYDPLETANANLYLRKIGGIAERYLVDHYGRIDSTLYGDLATDRFYVTWYLKERPETVGPPERIDVPDDIGTIKAEDPEAAREWRQKTRESFTKLMSDGYVVTGFERVRGECAYVLNKSEN